MVANDGYSDFASPLSPRCLLKYLEAGWDVERSRWDGESHLNDLHFKGTFILEIKNLGGQKDDVRGASRGRKYLLDIAHRLPVPG